MNLYPYQEAGVQWLMRTPRGGLFDDQGLGKTVQAIIAADRLDLRRILVVAPSAVLFNWKREFQKWSPRRKVDVVTHGRAKLTDGPIVTVLSHALLLNEGIVEQLRGFDLVVLDEAHFFRNPTAKRTRAFFLGREAVARRAPRSWLLTGTPMPNNPTELWSMLAGIAPTRLAHEGRMLSYAQWRDRYCVLAPTGYGRGWKIVGAQNTKELKQRLDGFALRRLKSEVLDLPPIRFTTVGVDHEGMLVDGGEFEATARGLSPEDALEAVAREESFSTWRRVCGVAKAAPAAELIANDLEGGVAKAVVVCHHKEVMDHLAQKLNDYGVVQIRGGMSPAARDANVQSFQTEPTVRVVIVQIIAGGIGVTLTAASDVYFAEQSFVPGDNAQAADRCHRIGQKNPVLVRFLFLAGSVDEVLVDILARKTQMVRAVLG